MSAVAPPWLTLPTHLDGSKVLLRTHRPDDGPALWQAAEEARGCPFLQWNAEVRSPADADALARNLATSSAERRSFRFAIDCRASGRLIGGCGLVRPEWEYPAYDLHWWLRRDAQGWGYATEAVRLLAGACFDHLDAIRVGATIQPDNLRSIKVAERVGFKREGTVRNVALDDFGRPVSLAIYGLTREDWEGGGTPSTLPPLAWLGQRSPPLPVSVLQSC